MKLLWYRNCAIFMNTPTDKLENVKYFVELQLEVLREGKSINEYWWVIDDVV